MSDKKPVDDDPERTLVTLDQLSQTIEVMTSVVNRLRRHLSDQINAQLESQAARPDETENLPTTQDLALGNDEEVLETQHSAHAKRQSESFVVEISQQEFEPTPKSTKTFH